MLCLFISIKVFAGGVRGGRFCPKAPSPSNKSVKNSLHHCQKGSQIQLLINGNAPEKYLVISNLVTVFILIAAGLVFLLVFVPMVYRHDPKNPNDKWNMMMKKVESLYKNRGV